jgi:hypothetical protein
MPRQKDGVWKFFTKVKRDNNSGPRAICTRCHKEIQGIADRLRKHYVDCWLDTEAIQNGGDDDSHNLPGTSVSSVGTSSLPNVDVENTARE